MPLDIDVRLPDEQKILDYIEEHQFPSMLHYDSLRFDPWTVAPVLGRIPKTDWKDVDKIRNLIFNRQNPYYGSPVEYAYDFDKLFPEVVHMINQIPIVNPMVILMKQNRGSTLHEDTHGDNDVKNIPKLWELDTEPRRYNIQMTKFDYKSFIVSDTKRGTGVSYDHISKELPAYLFCEQHYFHGANYAGPDKVSLCFLGTPDWPKHYALIKRSLEKYRDKAIIFEDGNDFLHR